MRYQARALLSATALILVCGAAAAYAYYGTYASRQAQAVKSDKAAKLFELSPDEVLGGELTARGETVTFRRTRDSLIITSPVEAPGDARSLAQLIIATLELRTSSTLPKADGDELKYGLEHPSVRVKLEGASGAKVELRVGQKNEFDGRIYVQNPSLPTIGLAEASFLSAVDLDLYMLRDKRVLVFAEEQVQSVETEKGGQLLYRLERDQAGWRIVAPESARADDREVARMLGAIRTLGAKRFTDDSGTSDAAILGGFGLEPPRYKVKLTLAGDQRHELRIGGGIQPDGAFKWFVRVEGERSIKEIQETVYREIDRSVLDLQDRQVINVASERVAGLRISGEGPPIELTRSPADANVWTLAGKSEGRVASYKVTALVYAMVSLKAKRIDTSKATAGDLKRTGLAPPRYRLGLLDASGQTLTALLVGKPPQGDPSELFVMAEKGKRIEVIDGKKLGSLPKSAKDLLEASAAPDAGH